MSIVEHRFSKLYLALGHSFTHTELVEEALTHPSVTAGEGRGKRNYERFEFLGDRVLGLCISELLLQRFRDEKVGQLARRHTALVRAETLTRVANMIDLGDFMNLSRSEEESGGRDNDALLSDCCEAIVAALYLDGGMEAARRFIYRHWVPLMNEALRPPKDPKTALQEWAQSRGLPLPVYTGISQDGPAHSPTFTVQVFVRGLPRSTASGRSKRAAEQAAAQLLMRTINTKEKIAHEAKRADGSAIKAAPKTTAKDADTKGSKKAKKESRKTKRKG